MHTSRGKCPIPTPSRRTPSGGGVAGRDFGSGPCPSRGSPEDPATENEGHSREDQEDVEELPRPFPRVVSHASEAEDRGDAREDEQSQKDAQHGPSLLKTTGSACELPAATAPQLPCSIGTPLAPELRAVRTA